MHSAVTPGGVTEMPRRLLLLPLCKGLVTGLLQGTATFSVFAAYALAMWYGANRIAQGATTPGTLVTVIALAMLGGSAASQVGDDHRPFCTSLMVTEHNFFQLLRTTLANLGIPAAAGCTTKMVLDFQAAETDTMSCQDGCVQSVDRLDPRDGLP